MASPSRGLPGPGDEPEPAYASPTDTSPPRPSAPRRALATIQARAAAAAHSTLTHGAQRLLAHGGPPTPHAGALESIQNDPAFTPSKAHRTQKELAAKREGGRGSLAGRAQAKIEGVGAALARPKRTAKAKAKKIAAGKVASVQRPQELNAALHGDGEGESLRVAWTTRHVRQARVVPVARMEFPKTERYMCREKDGSKARFAWERWVGHLLLYYSQDFTTRYIDDFDALPFDLDVLRSHGERLVLATAPWQVWVMRVRAVYCWEDPSVTARWLLLYVGLWYNDLIPSFFWAFVLYFVIRNRYFPSWPHYHRESVKATVSTEGSALALGEIIDRHGRDDWLDPFLDQLGPFVQLQLGDLADYLEVLANFYTWKSPRKTMASLCFFAACLAVDLLGDARFNLRIVWFIAGGLFFACWPIASRYPQYRVAVSPFRWIYWDVPTQADLAFTYLQQQCESGCNALKDQKATQDQGKEVRDTRLEQYSGHMDVPEPSATFDGANGCANTEAPNGSSDAADDDSDDDWHSVASYDDPLEGVDVASFPASSGTAVGHLVVHAHGVCFRRLALHTREVWSVPFGAIHELRKFRGGPAAAEAPQARVADPAPPPHAHGGPAGDDGQPDESKGKGLPLSPRRRKAGKLGSTHALEIVCAGGKVHTVETLQERDEAFNWILGFSGMRWQSVPPRLRYER